MGKQGSQPKWASDREIWKAYFAEFSRDQRRGVAPADSIRSCIFSITPYMEYGLLVLTIVMIQIVVDLPESGHRS